jgi:meiotically up-regulated gene 157 (Mug157) protein
MSLLIQAQTTDDDAEIMGCLDYVLKTAKLGLIHESIDVNSGYAYTSEIPMRNPLWSDLS